MRRALLTLVAWLCLTALAHAQPSYLNKATLQAATSGDVTVTLPAHQANDVFLGAAITWR